MTRSKLRRAIRETISAKLAEKTEYGLRELVTLITDTLIDWHNEDGCVEDVESCFDDIKAVLEDSGINPEKIGDEIVSHERTRRSN